MTDDDSPDQPSPTPPVPNLAAIYDFAGLEPPRLRRGEVSEATAITPERTLRWWRAMGFPEIEPGEIAFTRTDAQMALAVAELLEREVVDEARVLRLTHLMGTSFARLAEAQLDLLERILAGREVADGKSIREDEDDDAFTGRTDLGSNPLEEAAFIDFMATTMDYVWRRHLVAAVGRRMSVADSNPVQAVGFVDIAGFTKITAILTDDELIELVETFEAAARDAVTEHDGRVVKFIGDGMMYVAGDIEAAIAISIALFDALDDVDLLPELHAGVAVGPTLEVDGDVFGPTANLASRLSDYARAGTILVPADDFEELEELPDVEAKRLRRRHRLKGVGAVSLVSIRPFSDE